MSEQDKDVLVPEDSNEATEEQTSEETNNEAEVKQETTEEQPKQEEASTEEEKPNLDEEVEERPIHTVPVSKFNTIRKSERAYKEKAEKLERELKQAREAIPKEQADEIQQYAEDNGLTYEASEALVKLAKREVEKRLKPFESQFANQEAETHKQKVANEFDEKITKRIERDFAGATPDLINEIKDSIVNLAFSKRYNTYALEDIYEINKNGFKFQNKQTAETSGSGYSEVLNYDSVTDKDIEEMSPQEYKNYSDAMARKEQQWENVK